MNLSVVHLLSEIKEKRNRIKCEVNQFNFREAHLSRVIVVGLGKFCINKEA